MLDAIDTDSEEPKDEFTYEVRKLFSLGDAKEKVRMFASQVEPADSTPVPMRRRRWP